MPYPFLRSFHRNLAGYGLRAGCCLVPQCTDAARAAASERALLLQDAAPVLSGKRARKEPAHFAAGPTQVNRSLKLHRAPQAVAAPEAPPPRRTRPGNILRAARRKEAKAAYIASLSKLADKTCTCHCIDLSWKMRRVVAVCAYARSLEYGSSPKSMSPLIMCRMETKDSSLNTPIITITLLTNLISWVKKFRMTCESCP